MCAGEPRKWLSGVQVARRGYLTAVETRSTQWAKVCLEEDSAIAWYGYGDGAPWNVGLSCVEYVGVVVANERSNVLGLWGPAGGRGVRWVIRSGRLNVSSARGPEYQNGDQYEN